MKSNTIWVAIIGWGIVCFFIAFFGTSALITSLSQTNTGLGMVFYVFMIWLLVFAPAMLVMFLLKDKAAPVTDPPVEHETFRCANCGKSYQGVSAFCPHCGKPI